MTSSITQIVGEPEMPANLFYEIVEPKHMADEGRFWFEWLPNPPGSLNSLG